MTRIRFLPNFGFRGIAKIAFVAWDQTAGMNGGTLPVGTRGGNTPYSVAYEYASISVTNSAPVLNASGTPELDSIPAGISTSLNTGTLVTDLIARMGPSGEITDADPFAQQGIAINGLTGMDKGTWEFTINGGTNWTPIGTTGNSDARLLAADANTRVRFVPNQGFVGQVKLAFVGWDRTTGANGGIWNVSSRGGTSAFSLVYDYAAITVTNFAPVLTPSNSSYLDSISNAILDIDNVGTSIEDLISRMGPGGGITDMDPDALAGIAVVGMTETVHGTWEYTTDGGTSWSNLAATGSINARLLAADGSTRIRYRPNVGFVGTPKIAFVAWDRSNLLNGSLVNAGLRGGLTPFSIVWDYASIAVT